MYYVTVTTSYFARIFTHFVTRHTTHYIFDCPFEAAKFYENIYMGNYASTEKSYGYDETLKPFEKEPIS